MAFEIGIRIRKFREAKKLTQRELAGFLGVTSSRISNWENALNLPSAEMLLNICRALSVSPSELLDFRLDGELANHEMAIVMAYRARPRLQHAVDILLGLDDNRDRRQIEPG